MGIAKEFETVDLIIGSNAETLGIDAFALSLIKAERQIRKLFTFLVFQSPNFDCSHIGELRETLAGNGGVYFKGFIDGINALSKHSVKDLVGEKHDSLLARLEEATLYRNKIFHGQLTSHYLEREDLMALVADIREWCELLAASADSKFGYDGFRRDSFQKSSMPEIATRLKIEFADISSYKKLIKEHMQRRK